MDWRIWKRVEIKTEEKESGMDMTMEYIELLHIHLDVFIKGLVFANQFIPLGTVDASLPELLFQALLLTAVLFLQVLARRLLLSWGRGVKMRGWRGRRCGQGG